MNSVYISNSYHAVNQPWADKTSHVLHAPRILLQNIQWGLLTCNGWGLTGQCALRENAGPEAIQLFQVVGRKGSFGEKSPEEEKETKCHCKCDV